MFQNFGVQKISISEKSSEDLGMHISLPKPYAIFFRRFLELTTAIVWKAQVIVSSGMRITFLLSKQILCLKSIYFKIIFGHLMSSLLVTIFRHDQTNQPTPQPTAKSAPPRLPRPTNCPSKRKHPNLRKAVSGSLVPPTLQGAQSCCVGSDGLCEFLFVEIQKTKKHERNREQWAT